MSRQFRGSILLFLTAFIWGTAFVAQKSGLDLVSPLMFNGIRTLIGGIVLLPVIAFFSRKSRTSANGSGANEALKAGMAGADKAGAAGAGEALEAGTAGTDAAGAGETSGENRRTLWIGGICCGFFLMAAGGVQQIGLNWTTAGKSGFITALYVILVPLFGLFLRRKIRPIFWACVAASAVGLYLLCIPADGGFGAINKGDIITMVCAALFAFHILVIDHFSPKVDGVKLSCIQFFFAGIVTLIIAPFLDPAMGFSLPSAGDVLACWFPIFYSGVMSCGIAYTLQVVAQADVDPTIASMILCLESVFSVLAGAVILGEGMGTREIIGCVLMFIAILVAQLPAKEERLPQEPPGV